MGQSVFSTSKEEGKNQKISRRAVVQTADLLFELDELVRGGTGLEAALEFRERGLNALSLRSLRRRHAERERREGLFQLVVGASARALETRGKTDAESGEGQGREAPPPLPEPDHPPLSSPHRPARAQSLAHRKGISPARGVSG
jgi:hypothetical protein